MSLLRRAARRLASSRSLARLVLGIEVPPLEETRRYFDLTTPVLIRTVAPRLDASSRVLDMGTGAFAAIGLALWRRTGCHVVATDVDAGLVEQARANVAANDAPIEVIRASFFDGVFDRDRAAEAGVVEGKATGVEGKAAGAERKAAGVGSKAEGKGETAGAARMADEIGFDVVTFNAPYVPTRRVGADGSDDRYRGQSDGGETGTEVIEGFLAAFADEPRVQRAYLGVNTMMVPRGAVQKCIAVQARLRLDAILSPPLLPVDVYALIRDTASPNDFSES